MKNEILVLLMSISLLACNEAKNKKDDLQEIIIDKTEDGAITNSSDPDLTEDRKNIPFEIDSTASIDRFTETWTNGSQLFSIDDATTVDSKYGSGKRPLVFFNGGNRHEGGMGILGVLVNDSSIYILDSDIQYLQKGDLIVSSIFFEKECLLVFNSEGGIKEVIPAYKYDLGKDIDILIQNQLAGTFENKKSGERLTFFAVGNKMIWNEVERKFNIESGEFEALINVFTADQDNYAFERKGDQLDLYKLRNEDKDEWISEGWEPEGRAIRFTLVEKTQELTLAQFKSNVFAMFQ